ncbi:MAG: DUF2905 domain-containing protein [Vicinamibacterales bacterium]
MAQILILVGLGIAAVGVAIWLGLPLGRLPGDIVIDRNGFRLYLPIVTCIVVSLVLTAVSMLLRR